ncbi:MAG: TCR/Tet family MFS transporter [bacterium]|nr:TCR/Tet family MFS transporter [bacterium]
MRQRPTLAFILVTVFLDVLGIGLMIPVLPGLIGTMTQSPDQQAYWYGALAASYGVMQFFLTPLLGALSDQYGRRPVLLLSIFGLGFSYVVMALTHSLPLLLLARMVSGATGASFSVANAYVADITPAEKRGKSFGAVGAAFGLGFIVGPVLGGLLGAQDMRLPFWVAAGLSLTNWLYGFFVLPESLPGANRTRVTAARANPFGAFSHLARLRGVGSLIVVFAFTMLAQSMLQSTWVLYTQFRFGWGPKDNGFALFVVGLTAVIAQGLLLGRLLKRFGEVRLAIIGMSIATPVYLAYGLATAAWLMYALIVTNLLSFTVVPALQSLISRAASAGDQGLTQGSLNAISSIMMVIAPLLGTALLARVGHLPHTDWRIGITFFLCSAIQLLALIVAIKHFRHVPAQAA